MYRRLAREEVSLFLIFTSTKVATLQENYQKERGRTDLYNRQAHPKMKITQLLLLLRGHLLTKEQDRRYLLQRMIVETKLSWRGVMELMVSGKSFRFKLETARCVGSELMV